MSKPLLRNNFAADQGFTFKYQKKKKKKHPKTD